MICVTFQFWYLIGPDRNKSEGHSRSASCRDVGAKEAWGGGDAPHTLAYQLTLSQPEGWGQIMPVTLLISLGFSDLPTALLWVF